MDGSAGLPAHINIAGARLPQTYEAAKLALSNCSSIDECQDWANKAEALASYAKQADDESLFTYARRIQGRAVRRCQELLKQIPQNDGVRHDRSSFADTDEPRSRRQAAHGAGMSDRQYRTAMDVGRVPDDEFEAAVESDRPPSVTKLAGMGRAASAPIWSPPEGFADASKLLGTVRRFAEFCREHDAVRVAGGVLPGEAAGVLEMVSTIDGWLDRFVVNLKAAA